VADEASQSLRAGFEEFESRIREARRALETVRSEAAQLDKDLKAAEYHNERSTKMFTRCLNYSLKVLGERWQKDLFGTREAVDKLIRGSGGRSLGACSGHRPADVGRRDGRRSPHRSSAWAP
jgi:hypothetical protein